MVGRVGFGPTNQMEQIYSLPALTACIPAHIARGTRRVGCGDIGGSRTRSLRLEGAAS